jgi:hypothetical protein
MYQKGLRKGKMPFTNAIQHPSGIHFCLGVLYFLIKKIPAGYVQVSTD